MIEDDEGEAMEYTDKPPTTIEYMVENKAEHYYDFTDDRAEAMRLGREHHGDVIAIHLKLDRWGVFYDIKRKEIIMRGGRPVTPSLDDYGFEEKPRDNTLNNPQRTITL